MSLGLTAKQQVIATYWWRTLVANSVLILIHEPMGEHQKSNYTPVSEVSCVRVERTASTPRRKKSTPRAVTVPALCDINSRG